MKYYDPRYGWREDLVESQARERRKKLAQKKLELLYTKIGEEKGEPSQEDLKEIERLENIIDPFKKYSYSYKCPKCGSEWCDDPESWDCSARASGSPMDI